MTRIRLVAEWTVDFGDEQNADWVPEGSVLSLPGRSGRADVGLVVLEEDPARFLLEWHGPTAETSGHSRHTSLEAALEQADQQFGIPADAWFEARGDGAEG